MKGTYSIAVAATAVVTGAGTLLYLLLRSKNRRHDPGINDDPGETVMLPEVGSRSIKTENTTLDNQEAVDSGSNSITYKDYNGYLPSGMEDRTIRSERDWKVEEKVVSISMEEPMVSTEQMCEVEQQVGCVEVIAAESATENEATMQVLEEKVVCMSHTESRAGVEKVQETASTMQLDNLDNSATAEKEDVCEQKLPSVDITHSCSPCTQTSAECVMSSTSEATGPETAAHMCEDVVTCFNVCVAPAETKNYAEDHSSGQAAETTVDLENCKLKEEATVPSECVMTADCMKPVTVPDVVILNTLDEDQTNNVDLITKLDNLVVSTEEPQQLIAVAANVRDTQAGENKMPEVTADSHETDVTQVKDSSVQIEKVIEVEIKDLVSDSAVKSITDSMKTLAVGNSNSNDSVARDTPEHTTEDKSDEKEQVPLSGDNYAVEQLSATNNVAELSQEVVVPSPLSSSPDTEELGPLNSTEREDNSTFAFATAQEELLDMSLLDAEEPQANITLSSVTDVQEPHSTSTLSDLGNLSDLSACTVLTSTPKEELRCSSLECSVECEEVLNVSANSSTNETREFVSMREDVNSEAGAGEVEESCVAVSQPQAEAQAGDSDSISHTSDIKEPTISESRTKESDMSKETDTGTESNQEPQEEPEPRVDVGSTQVDKTTDAQVDSKALNEVKKVPVKSGSPKGKKSKTTKEGAAGSNVKAQVKEELTNDSAKSPQQKETNKSGKAENKPKLEESKAGESKETKKENYSKGQHKQGTTKNNQKNVQETERTAVSSEPQKEARKTQQQQDTSVSSGRSSLGSSSSSSPRRVRSKAEESMNWRIRDESVSPSGEYDSGLKQERQSFGSILSSFDGEESSVEPETMFNPAIIPNTSPQQYLFYDFEVPQSLVGRLIGRRGAFVNKLKATTDATVIVHPHKNRRLKICTVEGTRQQVRAALAMVRDHFPESQYPDLTLEQVAPSQHVQPPVQPTLNSQALHMELTSDVVVEVRVSAVVSAGELWVQQPLHPSHSALHRLLTCMNLNYGDGSTTPPLPWPVQEGTVCVAQIREQWMRCQVLSVQEATVLVVLLDVGGTVSLQASALRQIRYDYMSLPFQATQCFLHGVQPVSEEGWEESSAAVMEELVSGAILFATVVSVTQDMVPLVSLYRRDNDQYIHLNEKLVSLGHARWLSQPAS